MPTIEDLQARIEDLEGQLGLLNKSLDAKERQLLIAKTEVDTIKFMLGYCFSETKPT
jgi:hypothetical protein